MTTTCQQCGQGVIGLLRGRRRKFCSDRCRLASHRQQQVTRRQRETTPVIVPTVGDLAAWSGWVRGQYAVDATGEQLLRLILEADQRYRQAKTVLDRDGLTQPAPDGRTSPRPEVAIERDTRAAIQKLITMLGLESADADAETAADRPFPRRA
jgi:hypothetical protein